MPDIMPVISVGTDRINQCGGVRNNAGCRYNAGVLAYIPAHIGIYKGTTTAVTDDHDDWT